MPKFLESIDMRGNSINNCPNTILYTEATSTDGVNYVATIENMDGYVDGMTINILPNMECSDNPTLNINNLGALAIKNSSGETLSANDIKANIPIQVVRVGNNFFTKKNNGSGEKIEIDTTKYPDWVDVDVDMEKVTMTGGLKTKKDIVIKYPAWVSYVATEFYNGWSADNEVVDGLVYSFDCGNFSIKDFKNLSKTYKNAPTTVVSRFRSTIDFVEGKFYCMGGKSSQYYSKTNYTYYKNNDCYDPITDTWEAKQNMPTKKSDSASCVIDNKIYSCYGIIGQSNSINFNSTSENTCYDPVTNTWETKKAYSDNQYKAGCKAIVIDKKMYILGGFSGAFSYNYSSIRIYDPITDTWETMHTSTDIFYIFTQFVLINKYFIYCFGGVSDINSKRNGSNIVSVLDTITKTGTRKSSIPNVRDDSMAVGVDNKVFCYGGKHYDTDGTFCWSDGIDVYIPDFDN